MNIWQAGKQMLAGPKPRRTAMNTTNPNRAANLCRHRFYWLLLRLLLMLRQSWDDVRKNWFGCCFHQCTGVAQTKQLKQQLVGVVVGNYCRRQR